MAKNYHFLQHESPQGPIPEQELVSKIEEGSLSSDVRIWTEGQEDWEPAHQLLDSVPQPSLSGSERLAYLAGGLALPAAWLLLWPQSDIALADQLIYMIIGSLAVVLAIPLLLMMKKDLTAGLAMIVGAGAAVILRMVIMGLAGRIQNISLFGGGALLGGGLAGLSIWLLKSAITGRKR